MITLSCKPYIYHRPLLLDGLVNEQYQVTTSLCTVQVLLHCTRSGFSPAVKGR